MKPMRRLFELGTGVLLSFLLLAGSADAQVIYQVNSNADPGTGTCDVTECTLREAIAAANGDAAADQINFNISGSTVITLGSALPAITQPLTIDGTSQSGFATGAPVIELVGNGTFDGITVSASDVFIRALIIRGFLVGVVIDAGANGAIGSDLPLDLDYRNAIYGNQWGIRSESSAGSYGIIGNTIGTNVAGDAAIANTSGGIDVAAGTPTIQHNLISGNGGPGIRVASVTGTRILGNLIGTNLAGTGHLPNGDYGIEV